MAPKPVNFLMPGATEFTVAISRASACADQRRRPLARVAFDAFIRAATEIADEGNFDGFAGLIANPELNAFFRDDRQDAIPMTVESSRIPSPGSRSARRSTRRRRAVRTR